MQKQQRSTFNSILVNNLPNTSSREVDLTILVCKTHILPFLSDYWFDREANAGHLLLKKTRFIDFVLFVLKNYLKQEDDMNCIFEKEIINPRERTDITRPSSSSGFIDNFLRTRGISGSHVAVVIILS